MDIKTALYAPLRTLVDYVKEAECDIGTGLTEPCVIFPSRSQVYQGVLVA